MKVTCPDCGKQMVSTGVEYECECGYVSSPEPSIGTLQYWESEGGCETPCECWTEMDGHCPHGNPSWALLMGLI